MKRTFTLAAVFCLSFINAAFPIGNPFAGARALALSDAVVAVSDSWSAFHNQAGLASFSTVNAGIFYQSKFGLKELSLGAGTVIFPVKTGVFGLSFSQFGSGSFKEQKFSLAFAKNLSPKISAGIQIDYLTSLMPENQRSKGFATVEGGLLFRPEKNLVLGAHVFNPWQQGLKTVSGKIKSPAVFRFGGSYKFSEELTVCAETGKTIGNRVVYKSGVEYLPAKNMAFRFGVSMRPFVYSAGFGYRFGKIVADIGFGYHGYLGLTPSVSIQYSL